MDNSEHLTQTVVISDRALPSNAEVQKAVEDRVLTLEPKLRTLNQHVSNLLSHIEVVILTAGNRSSTIPSSLTKNTKPTIPSASS